ncbi:MAG: anaerobic ribonucleoside-triphosphate reductase activating protein [Bacilli bacterium]|nr:anaerobic ribonucleoside-triphosphate reductase activating protein [Bacilli bacterium]
MMKIRLAAPIQVNSVVDGEGIRAIIWTQGCLHNCKGCHNQTTHDLKGGELVEIEKLKEEIMKLSIEDGITFSGGEPFLQAKACSILAKFIKEQDLNIWCYTGFIFEDIIKDKDKLKFLKYIDVLVDGPFILSKKSLNLTFRGSSNQRIIDVQRSLHENKTITISKYDVIINEKIYQKDATIFI